MTEDWIKPVRAFVKQAYGTPSPILMPDKQGRYLIENDMLSSQGVRQGDPLGSLLFACALQTALQKTQQYIQDNQIRAWIVAYHDDTKVFGEPDRLMEVLEVIKHEFANIDLCMQTEKSRIIDFHWETRSEKYKSDVRALNISVDEKCGLFLGCPVGVTPQEEQSFMHSKLAEQLEVLDRLDDPRVPVHQAATILRVSTIHKLDHWLRNVEPDVMLPIAKTFDQQVRQCLYNKMDVNQQLNAALRTGQRGHILSLTSAPISLGGDGITKTYETAHVCWVAGVACAVAVPTTLNAFHDFDNGEPRPYSHIHDTLNYALQIIKEQCHIPPEAIKQSSLRPPVARSHSNSVPSTGNSRSEAAGSTALARLKLLHNKLPDTAERLFELMSGANHRPGSTAAIFLLGIIRNRKLIATKYRRKVQEYRSSHINRARLMAIRAKGATRIMHLSVGRTGNVSVSDLSYRTHFSLRHGISLSLAYNERCHGCNNDIRNIPNHELGCVRGFGSEITARHNLIRNTIARTMNEIGGVANCEPNPFSDTNKRPDIEWLIDGRRIYFDIAVTHPLNSTVVKQAARTPLAAAKHMETIKNTKYQKLCTDMSAEFIPLVIESFGGYGQEFGVFLEDLHNIARYHLRLTDGESVINEMLNQIAFHVIGLNGLIMKKAASNGAD